MKVKTTDLIGPALEHPQNKEPEMTKIEELKAVYEAATPGEWKACREHEDFDGPMFDIDEWEQAEYAARPFVYICASAQRVTNNHDLFQFDEANAHLITLMHNNLPALLEAASLLDDLINSYDDTGCDGCGVVDSSINERAIALREKLQ
jgi:hypothetical protein